jgi:aspartyl-tRNA(Asn)/glutamyl-tRNA(Gln) amidotransferase subunit A
LPTVTDLTALTIAEARDALAKKDFTALELTEAYLSAIEKARALNAFVLETPEKARDMAKASDARRASGAVGALEGIPLGVKDLYCTEGVRTTACSKILDGFVPPYESTVTSNLWADGAVMLGKLANDEFAMGSSNETSCFGPVVNPWRRKRADGSIDPTPLVPGGSSGGSSAAVAAHLVAGATGTDTGGSIRQPAAFTGTDAGGRRLRLHHQPRAGGHLGAGPRPAVGQPLRLPPARARRDAGRRSLEALPGSARPVQGLPDPRGRGDGQ